MNGEANNGPERTPELDRKPQEKNENASLEDLDELMKQLVEAFENRNFIQEEFSSLDRQLDQQRLAHCFIRATKSLEDNLPSKARDWVTHAEEITEKLNDSDNKARCLYWLGRIDWYEGREIEAYWHFVDASKKLARGCEEMRRIPMYLEWLRPGIERDKARARLSRHGFHPPHEKQPTRVNRKKMVQSSTLPDMSYNRYSNPGLKRKREHMEPDVAVAIDSRRKPGKKKEPRSRTIMTFESDRHVHPGEEVNVEPPQNHHLAYDFSWPETQRTGHHPPSRKKFHFSKHPKGKASRWRRSYKVFSEQPWEDKVPKRITADGKTGVTIKMLTQELDPVSRHALQYGDRTPRS